jgi:hypothetical protein
MVLFIQPALPPTRSKVLPFGCCSGTAGRFEVFQAFANLCFAEIYLWFVENRGAAMTFERPAGLQNVMVCE